ncbi:MAG: magnesium transporter [Candidatus Omnitrophica bacterium]|nr:magnesium transporter [Candidatus Omnitrophota bacterium]
METSQSLLALIRRYVDSDPVAAAHSLESLAEEDALAVLKELPPDLSSRIFPHLELTAASAFLQELPAEQLPPILERLEPQQGAAILMHLTPQAREKFVQNLPAKLKKSVQEYLAYPEDSAGRMMSTAMLSFHEDIQVQDAVHKIRLLAQKQYPASYAYVVDNTNRLVGVINMRDLMLASPQVPLSAVMRREVFSVNCFMDREQVADELGRRKFFAAPVVDPEGRLLGLVKAEKLIKGIQEEATEDLQKMFGAGGDERAFSSVGFSLKKRMPWLAINLVTAFGAGAVVACFEGIIAKITVLAVYLPIVAGQGGNAGAQSLAVVMRAIVMREIRPGENWKLLVKEGTVGLINGVLIGVLTAGAAWMWQGNPMLGAVVALAMTANLFAAGLAGAAIPMTMKRLGFDPAQSSNIVLTTVTDIVGFLSFLGFAVLFQDALL